MILCIKNLCNIYNNFFLNLKKKLYTLDLYILCIFIYAYEIYIRSLEFVVDW